MVAVHFRPLVATLVRILQVALRPIQLSILYSLAGGARGNSAHRTIGLATFWKTCAERGIHANANLARPGIGVLSGGKSVGAAWIRTPGRRASHAMAFADQAIPDGTIGCAPLPGRSSLSFALRPGRFVCVGA